MDKLLRVENLNKDKILHQVSFEMKQGEMLAVMGPSGSGKSTLLYNVSGMDQPTGGKVWLGDTEITGLSEDAKADLRLHQMGFIFQQMNMIANLNILDNILLPVMQANKGKGGKSKSELMAEAKRRMRQLSISELGSRQITQVSGGQLQRACICRSIMNEPEILFADEPTGNLDTKTGEEIMALLQEINQTNGQTILMVTHSPDAAKSSSRIITVRDGIIC